PALPTRVCRGRQIFGPRLPAGGAELGPTASRLSDMGPDGNTRFAASSPAVAYNGVNNEYLVVWEGDDTIDNEFEIYGQRVEADTGLEIGTDFRLSDVGPDGDTHLGAFIPAVAYNGTNTEDHVVWSGADNKCEIFGQRLNAATGAQVGANDFRLSDVGPDGDTRFGAFSPALAYNGAANEYLVVWHGDDTTGTLVDNEFEVFGQRLNAAT